MLKSQLLCGAGLRCFNSMAIVQSKDHAWLCWVADRKVNYACAQIWHAAAYHSMQCLTTSHPAYMGHACSAVSVDDHNSFVKPLLKICIWKSCAIHRHHSSPENSHVFPLPANHLTTAIPSDLVLARAPLIDSQDSTLAPVSHRPAFISPLYGHAPRHSAQGGIWPYTCGHLASRAAAMQPAGGNCSC